MVEEDIIISDKENLNNLIKKFQEGGKEKIHVLTDFDRTLTKAYVNGEKVPSIISRLRDKEYLSEDYSEQAKALANYYHPIELNSELPLEEKKKEMNDWWTKHFDLLIKYGLNRKHIELIIGEGIIQFREGAEKFLDLLHENKIPLIIVSSSGLGYDSIEMFLKSKNKLYNNIKIISNSFEWDNEGKILNYKKPIIHVFNKDETILKEIPEIYEKIEDKKNVILLGDSLGDLGMIKGFYYENLLKIGFLNYNIEKDLNLYKENFDIVLVNNSDMNYINEIMEEILNDNYSKS